ncbi:MAG TPA: VIT1/CCC1 transporter family protein [Acidobacteriaceae bacterium]
MPDKATRNRLLVALASNWQAEMTGFHTYTALADRESDVQRRGALRTLAAAEKHHAELWGRRIEELGGHLPVYRGSVAGEANTLASRVGGDALALRRLELDESRDIARYGRQLREIGDEASLSILRQVIDDEQEHYRTLGNLIRGRLPLARSTPEEAQRALDALIAARDKGRRRTAGWIGDAIYGINDGLGSIFGIVSGVSGATLGNSHFVLIAGLAGMVASALSMGSGAYLAAKSEREIYEAEYAREAEAVHLNEAEARELLSLTYQVRGLQAEDADRFVEHLARDKQQLIKSLARERLDTTEEGLRRPLASALSGAVSTAVGAFIPIIPFFFTSGVPAVVIAAVVSLVAHFAVGAAKSLITIRSWWKSGLEMTVVGAVEGVITYALGIAIGRLGGG